MTRSDAVSAPLRHRERRDVPLNLITGRSPANCRPDADDADVADLAASIDAIGLLTPLFVSEVPGALLRFHVDAGGRRLAALRMLRDRGRLAADHKVPCDVLVADETTVREISVAENTIRKDLHPADQCAAFAAMIGTGASEDRIAADFGISVRQVRQRLKLTKLSPRVRALWRDGTLSLEVAQALTLAPSHEAQDAIVDGPDKWMLRNAGQVRLHLLSAAKAVRFDTPQALYVGLDAYVAAGGDVEENLFDEHPLIFDAALLDRLAREKMMREGAATLEATGYGFCMIEADVEDEWRWPRIEPDYLPAERGRLEAIAAEHDATFEDTDDAEARIAALDAEEESIEARAIDRACTPAMKAAAGIFLGLDGDGRLKVERGIKRPSSRPEADGTPGASHTPRPAAATADAPKAAKPADPIEAAGSGGGMIRTILETTIYKALAAIIGGRPDLALMVMVARYGGTWRPDWITEGFGLSPNDKPDGLLRRVCGESFERAIAHCADAPLADLSSAFATIVGSSIRLTPRALLGTLDPLMRALGRRGAALKPAFVAAMDYDAYFAAATRQACLAALEAMETPLVDRQAKKPALAALAGEAARANEWLPFPLAGWAAVEATSPEAPRAIERADAGTTLAEAMDDAIVGDEASKSALRLFLEDRCELVEGGKVKASVLYALYREADADPVSLIAFGAEIASLEIEKKRTAQGVFYLGIAVRRAGSRAADD